MRVAIVGGSDAGIEAARHCLELEPSVRVNLLVADPGSLCWRQWKRAS